MWCLSPCPPFLIVPPNRTDCDIICTQIMNRRSEWLKKPRLAGRPKGVQRNKAGGQISLPGAEHRPQKDYVGGRHATIPDFSVCGYRTDRPDDRPVLSALRNTGRQELLGQCHPAFYQGQVLAAALHPIIGEGCIALVRPRTTVTPPRGEPYLGMTGWLSLIYLSSANGIS
jgi:hypothetical protein